MARFLATALASCILVSGCSVIRVDEMPMEGSGGSIELKAIRRDDPDELTSGYAFRVKGQERDFGWIPVDSAGPSLLLELPPGPYSIEVRGRGISRKRFEVEVRPGVRTSVAVLWRNVKRNTRIEKVAADVGKAVLYTVGFVVYAVIWVVVECSTDDDDEDDDRARRCSNDSSRARSTPPAGYAGIRRR